jgi:hypothetical protein
MANKDISPATIANILFLISTVSQFINFQIRNSKSYNPSRPLLSSYSIIPDPSKAGRELQSWVNTYVKPGAPSAGTATISTAKTAAEWRNNFFIVRTALLADISPAAIAALDAWFKKYSSLKITPKFR